MMVKVMKLVCNPFVLKTWILGCHMLLKVTSMLTSQTCGLFLCMFYQK